MTAEIEKIIRAVEKGILQTKSDYLSGRLGIIVQEIDHNYAISLITKDNPLLSVQRLQNTKRRLRTTVFTGKDVTIFLDEVTELKDRNLWIVGLHVFVREKGRK